MKVAAGVALFTRATSLGGPHNLIEHHASIEGRDTKTAQNLLRVSIGLENHYAPFHLARADMFRRLSRSDQAWGNVPACAAFRPNEHVRRFIEQRLP